jgi:hypothetical protein
LTYELLLDNNLSTSGAKSLAISAEAILPMVANARPTTYMLELFISLARMRENKRIGVEKRETNEERTFSNCW